VQSVIGPQFTSLLVYTNLLSEALDKISEISVNQTTSLSATLVQPRNYTVSLV
jgi:hypothetical protein